MFSTTAYTTIASQWPQSGRHILAAYDDESVIVYQAYRPSIGLFAAQHGYFGGPDFKLTRMSWVKPNFLWMMYRSGWGTKPGQEIILAIRLKRTFFVEMLRRAVPSSYRAGGGYSDRQSWQKDVARSDVRLQWDPDHYPAGGKHERRAIQLGLRHEMLATYARDAIISIADISDFVAQQRPFAVAPYEELYVPAERVFPVENAHLRARLGLA